ncbi:MAG TPA: hypothetical protein VLX61_03655 [Anaerolineales bacterium]|nr:hypothetical protein [Anaerolineales bacterium]
MFTHFAVMCHPEQHADAATAFEAGAAGLRAAASAGVTFID